MCPPLAFLLGRLLGVLFMCSMISMYLLMKLFQLVQRISSDTDDVADSN